MSQEPTIPFKINIPLGLKERLSNAATRSGRSLTSEIITRLEASISLADDHGLDFTYEAMERMILDLVASGTEELEQRVRDLEAIASGRDPFNRPD